MNKQSIDIERVVREVLAALEAAPTVAKSKANGHTEKIASAGPVAPAAIATVQPSEPAKNSSVAEGDLAIDSRVVTMGELTGRLATVRRLVVSRKAIVTPAVQDELLRRNIALVYSDAPSAPAAAAPRLVMICLGNKFDPAPLMAVLGREGVQVEQSTLDCLIASTNQLAAELAKPNTLGLLLTRHTAVGLCLANRLCGVRAVTGCDAPGVATAAAAVGANLLVLNPRLGSFFQLKQMVADFCRGGVRPCPEVFCEQLG